MLANKANFKFGNNVADVDEIKGRQYRVLVGSLENMSKTHQTHVACLPMFRFGEGENKKLMDSDSSVQRCSGFSTLAA